MAALADTATAPERKALNRIQQLAALLVMLGPDSAAEVLKQFSPREIEAITREMARFNLITREQQEDILREFSEVALAASTALAAGVEVTRHTLEKALGSFHAGDLLDRVLPSRAPSVAMRTIADMDPRHLHTLLREEQPQTIAFVLSHLPAERAARVLALVRPDLRDTIIERLATLAPTPVEVAERVVEVLIARLGSKPSRAPSRTGGVATAADILNAMDKLASRSLLGSIEERNTELSQAIRRKMFTFEDLLRVHSQDLQRILRETDMRDLALALQKASEPLKQHLLSNISRRGAEAVEDEMSLMGRVRRSDVEAAQFRIVESVRKLEAEGEIELDRSGATDYGIA
jgi:flagellar motor switch protein FliG